MTREDTLDALLALLPQATALEGDGWPAIVRWNDGARSVEALIYVSRIGEPGLGSSGTARPLDERRFQNPGQGHPIFLDPVRPTLLLGLADSEPADDESTSVLSPVLASHHLAVQPELEASH